MVFHWSLNDSKSHQVSKTLINFRPILIMLSFGRCPLVLLFLSPPVPLSIINILLFSEFFTLASADGLYLEFEWQQVSRTLLSILADLNSTVVWITRVLISDSSSPCTNLLVTVPRAPITIGITVTFIFYSFFSSLASFRYLSLSSLSIQFYSVDNH